MNTMTAHTHTAPSRARRGGLIASLLFAAVAVLAGCSAANDAATGFEDDLTNARFAEYGIDGVDARFADLEGDVAYDVAEAPESTGTSTTHSSTVDRSVIVTGDMYITVEDPIEAADQAADIVLSVGGRIDARDETAPNEEFGGSAWLRLRIPSDELDAVIDDLRELGVVDYFSTDSYDVTTEVADLEIEISTLRTSIARIEALLLDAENLYDIILLEDELASRQSRLESLEARQRGLDDQVSMSTIDLSLTTEPIEIVPEDDSPQSFWDGLVAGWEALVGFLAGVLTVVGVLLPWIALLAVIVLPMIFWIRSRRKARNAAKKSTPARRGAAWTRKPAAKKQTARK
jgi:hypothetical protein